jgi:hypothetical protein
MNDNYIVTSTGRKFNLTNPSAVDVHPLDIARGLANMPRFTGQARYNGRTLSVARHSLHVLYLLREESCAVRLAGLLHDAHEAYLCDLSSPLKAEMRLRLRARHEWHLQGGMTAYERITSGGMTAYECIASHVQNAVNVAFELPQVAPIRAVKRADTIALLLERDAILPRPTDGWGSRWPAWPPGAEVSLCVHTYEPEIDEAEFLTALRNLRDEVRGAHDAPAMRLL